MRDRPWLGLAALLLAIIVASCMPVEPDFELTVNGVTSSGARASTTRSTGCSTYIGDDFPRSPDAVTVPATGSLTLEIATGSPVREIRGALYMGESREPVSFTFARGSRGHVIPDIRPGPYRITVNVEFPGVFETVRQTRIFSILLEAKSLKDGRAGPTISRVR